MDRQNLTLIIVIIVLFVGITFFVINRPDSNRQSTSSDSLTKITNVGESTPTANSFTQPPAPENNKVQNSQEEEKMTSKLNKYSTQPTLNVDSTKKYTALLQTTEGNITIELNTKDTPITANNFIFLAIEGFYNDTVFHRVIEGFMIQGGDPVGDGTGGPGYKFKDEPVVGEYTRGTVAMANSGPDTNGSQFFIMHDDNPLPKAYVIFGKVVEGMDTVDKIATAPVTSSGRENSKPVNPVKVISVTIDTE